MGGAARARAHRPAPQVRRWRNFGHQIALSAGLKRARGCRGLTGRRPAGPPRGNPRARRALARRLRCRLRRSPASRRRPRSPRRQLSSTSSSTASARSTSRSTKNFRLFSRRALDTLLAMPERARSSRRDEQLDRLSAVGGVSVHARCAACRRDQVPAETHAALRGGCGDLVLGDTDPLRGGFSGSSPFPSASSHSPGRFTLDFLADETVAGWTLVIVVVLLLGGVQLLIWELSHRADFSGVEGWSVLRGRARRRRRACTVPPIVTDRNREAARGSPTRASARIRLHSCTPSSRPTAIGSRAARSAGAEKREVLARIQQKDEVGAPSGTPTPCAQARRNRERETLSRGRDPRPPPVHPPSASRPATRRSRCAVAPRRSTSSPRHAARSAKESDEDSAAWDRAREASGDGEDRVDRDGRARLTATPDCAANTIVSAPDASARWSASIRRRMIAATYATAPRMKSRAVCGIQSYSTRRPRAIPAPPSTSAP